MIIHGDSMEVLKTFEANSIDALVTDPPYGLGDTSPIKVKECLQAWMSEEVYEANGSGFMSKQWDKWVPSPSLWKEVFKVLKPGAHGLVFSGSRTEDLMSISLRLAGFEVRDRLVWIYSSGFPKSHNISKALKKKSVIESEKWEGFGTALKPAYEPIILIRKPIEGTIIDNVLKYGVGGINIDDSRIKTNRNLVRFNKINNSMFGCGSGPNTASIRHQQGLEPLGLFPSNILLDQSINDPILKRYFYCSKASQSERVAGLKSDQEAGNIHPTVKPIQLMRYLCKLITPKEGTILEPFAGSGTTLCAAAMESFNPIGIEREEEYIDIIKARLKHWSGGRYDMTEETPQPKTGEQLTLF